MLEEENKVIEPVASVEEGVTPILTAEGFPTTPIHFEIQKRRLLVVWVYSLKQLKNLKRFGDVMYVSRRMKYILLYMNEEDIAVAEEKIQRLHFVRNVERSYRPDIEMNFADKIGTQAAYQVADDGYEPEELNTEIKLADNLV